MVEKVQESEGMVAAEEPAEIKACVGATGGGEAAAPAAETAKGDGSAIPPAELERLRDDLIAALKTVFDPEIPVDIYELGLIYRLDIDDDRNIEVDMTLTAPGCPVAGDMPGWVENALSAVPGVGQVKVKLVFDPPWDMSRMSDEAKLALNMF
jgi:FeS assembly SUF system protein